MFPPFESCKHCSVWTIRRGSGESFPPSGAPNCKDRQPLMPKDRQPQRLMNPCFPKSGLPCYCKPARRQSWMCTMPTSPSTTSRLVMERACMRCRALTASRSASTLHGVGGHDFPGLSPEQAGFHVAAQVAIRHDARQLFPVHDAGAAQSRPRSSRTAPDMGVFTPVKGSWLSRG